MSSEANGRTVVDAFNLELPQEDILETPGRNVGSPHLQGLRHLKPSAGLA